MDPEQQLLSYSMHIDEAKLQMFIRQVAQGAAEQFRAEISAVQHAVGGLRDAIIHVGDEVKRSNSRVAELEERMQELQDHVKSVEAVQHKFTRLAQGGFGGGHSSQAAKPAVDEEVVKELKSRCDALEEMIVSNKQANDDEHASMVERINTARATTADLLRVLGLENNETYGGIIPTGNGTYLTGIHTSLAESSKRMTVIESSLKGKCEQNEIDLIAMSVTDLRGYCDTAVMRLEGHSKKLSAQVDAFSRGIRDEISTKTSVTDLEVWKREMNSLGQESRESAASSMDAVRRLESEFAILKDSIVETMEAGRSASRASQQQEQQRQQHVASDSSTPAATPRGAAGSRKAAAAEEHTPSSTQQSSLRPSSAQLAVKKRLHGTGRYSHYAEVTPDSNLKVEFNNMQRPASAAAAANRKY